MTTIILSVLAFASAAVHIYPDRAGLRRYAYVFKPPTMVLLLLIAVFTARDNVSVYGLAIITGIVFFLAGDVAMMLPKKRIVIGMGAFLVAHVCLHHLLLIWHDRDQQYLVAAPIYRLRADHGLDGPPTRWQTEVSGGNL